MSNASQIARGGALKLSEGRAPVRERLMAMLFLTALLHAIVILGVSFSSAGRGGGSDVPQIDVLLVTRDIPEARENPQATYLAQRTQIGSGDTDAHEPPGSPASRGAMQSATQPLPGRDEPDSQRAQSSARERVLVTSAASAEIRYFGQLSDPSAAPPNPESLGAAPGDPQSGRGDAVELLLRGRRNSEQWISPDTRASALAPYLAEWKRKVERVGTLNFPSAARAGLSGSPVVEVQIAADGHLAQARVRRSSGYGALDEAALTILRLASPFNPFPADLATQYSRLRFAYQWDFVAGALASGAGAPSGPQAAPTAPVLAPAAPAPAPPAAPPTAPGS